MHWRGDPGGRRVLCAAGLVAAFIVAAKVGWAEPRSAEYVIAPSDTVQVEVWGHPEATTSMRVRPDGFVSHPLAGEVQAAGMTADTPVAVVENASLPTARRFHTCLRQLGAAAMLWQLSGPALILVGEIYRRREALSQPSSSDEDEDSFIAYGNSWFR